MALHPFIRPPSSIFEFQDCTHTAICHDPETLYEIQTDPGITIIATHIIDYDIDPGKDVFIVFFKKSYKNDVKAYTVKTMKHNHCNRLVYPDHSKFREPLPEKSTKEYAYRNQVETTSDISPSFSRTMEEARELARIKLQTEVENIQKRDLSVLRRNFNRLKGENECLKGNNEALESENERLESIGMHLRSQLFSLKGENERLESQLFSQTDQVRQSRVDHEEAEYKRKKLIQEEEAALKQKQNKLRKKRWKRGKQRLKKHKLEPGEQPYCSKCGVIDQQLALFGEQCFCRKCFEDREE